MDGAGTAKVAYSCNKGNYKGYYKMRPESNNRLQYLSEEWFRGKACLDVGCNDGQFCIALAEKFAPAFILGIDPDFVLIDSAQSRLKRLLYAENQKAVAAVGTPQTVVEVKPKPTVAFRSGFLPRALAVKAPVKRLPPAEPATATAPRDISGTQTEPSGSTPQTVPAATTSSITISAAAFPHNMAFKARDVFDVSCTLSSQKEGKYDTITCFSVSKWVHLNGGDSKLLEFFCRLYSLVRSGGRVIIEYQPWKSYENNKSTSDVTKAVFPTIHIKPDLFEWVLTFIVGFEIEARCGVHLDQAKGFDRPILVLRRPVTVQVNGGSVGGSSGDKGAAAGAQNVPDSVSGANSSNATNKNSKKANNSSTDGFRGGKKLWENVGSFADLCNIVYKRIQRGTVVSISNTSTSTGSKSSSSGSGGSSGDRGGTGSKASGTMSGLVTEDATGTVTGANVVSLKRSADAVEEPATSDKKSKKDKKASVKASMF